MFKGFIGLSTMSNAQLLEDTQIYESEELSSHLDQIQIPSTHSETAIPSDPVVIMQVLQVMDRERDKELRGAVADREDVRDAIEATIAKIMKIDSGLVGMIKVALKGRVIPKDLSAELDILLEYEGLLTLHIDKMTETIETSRMLGAKADVDADKRNRLILRQRAVVDLDNIRADQKLVNLKERCEIFVEEICKAREAKAE